MAIVKRSVIEYLGPGTLVEGDIKYWNGDCWISLPPGNTGEHLVTHGTGSPPSWEAGLLTALWDSSVAWDNPGFGWSP